MEKTRREFIRASVVVGAGLALAGCESAKRDAPGAEVKSEPQGKADGYEDAVKQIGDIEGALGLSDISQFTAPPPANVPKG